jgi:7,8-dihydropterin-6-yl-methyl-4-(beta-D-ribofuranosyl)aminobenzene 5'-phosphate synthase
MGKYRLKRIARNHCAGPPAVKFKIDLGYLVVRRSGHDESMSDLYVANGDSVTFD